MRSLSLSSLAALVAVTSLAAFPPTSAQAGPAAPVISDNAPHVNFATVAITDSTQGAIIFVKTDHFGFPSDPTHNGATPTNGTFIYQHSFAVPYGEGYNDPDSRLYTKALAWKSGLGNSVVVSDECDNTGQ